MKSFFPPLNADENIEGALVRAMRRLEWDVVRGIDVHPAGTSDEVHFAEATALHRVLLSHDTDMLAIAARWQAEGRGFAGLVFLARRKHQDIRSMLRALKAVSSRLSTTPPENQILFA